MLFRSGEAVMTAGGGHQTSFSGRWGDYSSMFVDPTDNCTFYHTNEYFTATTDSAWSTRVGLFKFPGCSVSTAAGVSISGRVLTQNGRGLRNARVSMRDQNGNIRIATTGSFGYYHFDDVESGQTYIIGVASKRFHFTSRVIQVIDNLSDVDFVAEP